MHKCDCKGCSISRMYFLQVSSVSLCRPESDFMNLSVNVCVLTAVIKHAALHGDSG